MAKLPKMPQTVVKYRVHVSKFRHHFYGKKPDCPAQTGRTYPIRFFFTFPLRQCQYPYFILKKFTKWRCVGDYVKTTKILTSKY